MKKVTNKAFGILALVVLSVPAQAGWLSNLGQRIVNGAANTVQTNISGKVNKAVNDVMDGKVQTQNNETKKSTKKSAELGNTDSKVFGQPNQKAVDSNVISTNKKGDAISYTGKYDKINFGKFSFTGEEIYYKQLLVGQTNVVIRELLDPGYYVIHVKGTSYEVGIIFAGIREDEGIPLGYGVNIKKTIVKDGGLYLTGNKDGVIHVVEVAKGTQGLLEVALVNHESLKGSGNLSIYKIPGPNLEIIK